MENIKINTTKLKSLLFLKYSPSLSISLSRFLSMSPLLSVSFSPCLIFIYKKALKFTISLVFSIIFFTQIKAQEVYHHTSNTSIYEFLDEFANLRVIDINTTVKPYSRIFIATKLKEIQESDYTLNKRQQDELNFYLKDFNKELMINKDFDKRFDILYFKDSLFTFSVNVILGGEYFMNDSGSFYHRWNGAEASAYVGNHWGFYASLRDNHESSMLAKEDYLTQRMGANYKHNDGGGDFSEMRGGLTYSWDWGSFGII